MCDNLCAKNRMPSINVDSEGGELSDGDFRTQLVTVTEIRPSERSEFRGNEGEPVFKRCREEDEETLCTICTDEWTSSGTHQVAALRCGHVFGKSCLELWHRSKTDKGQRGAFASCPNCSAPYKLRDIFPLYVRNIKALDISERECAIRLAKDAQRDRDRAAAELGRVKMLNVMCELQLDQVRKELSEAKRKLSQLEEGRHEVCETTGARAPGSANAVFTSAHHSHPLFEYDFSITIGDRDHSSRVMAYCASRNLILASKRFGAASYGLVTLNLRDIQLQKFYPVHHAMIRDIKIIERDAEVLALSASMDATLKLSSPYSSVVLASFQLPGPGWSCCFNETLPHMVYAGTMSGTVVEFNSAVPGNSAPSRVFSFPDVTKDAPIHSLFYLGERQALLGANLNGCYPLLDRCPSGQQCYTLTYDSVSRHFAASFRNPARQTTRHCVGTLNFVCLPLSSDNLGDGASAFLEVLFQPSFVVAPPISEHSMPKSILFTGHPARRPTPHFLCVRDEQAEETLIFDIGLGPTAQPARLKVKFPESSGPPMAYEFCPASAANPPQLLVLTGSAIFVFKLSRLHPTSSNQPAVAVDCILMACVGAALLPLFEPAIDAPFLFAFV
ncbi:hypothetical protein L0F63_000742 [Massospora cicadina]|nr:hypothetical protein L0F63_000742 [Massospora cicadina]